MCGRYSLTNVSHLGERFKVKQENLPVEPRYNVAPTQQMPVVYQHENEERKIELMKWGLIPFWSKEPKASYSTINARAEGIADKPAYRRPIRNQRCLIPADGFYEWQKSGLGKLPFYIHLKDSEIFSFAGLYDLYKDPNGQIIKTYTIITTDANELMAPIHNRMPVILHRENEEEWLDPAVSDPFQVTRLLVPFPDGLMEAYPVSKAVNSPGTDVPELIRTMNSA
ncbi:MAG TPA: SOS response-associated peptidase [Chloroflexia bacterium]|nr:SOS response-associated peptidase [Chloroflexia bacterium]